jgi:hypothetical protein
VVLRFELRNVGEYKVGTTDMKGFFKYAAQIGSGSIIQVRYHTMDRSGFHVTLKL